MKKTYIVPTAKNIVFSTDDNVLAATSGKLDINEGTGEIDGGMSNERNASSSIWGED